MAAPQSKTLQNIKGNWTINRALSSDFGPGLKLQGINYFVRKAASLATVHLKATQPSDNHISMQQQISAMKIPGTAEEYILDWTWREFKDPLYGNVEARSQWISVEDAKKEGASGDWIEGDSDGMLVRSEAKGSNGSWFGMGYWSFEVVDGERRYTRRVKIWTSDGQEEFMRVVYDFDGE